ncbi:MAG: GNAT family N-acetyltransferase [Verrucomicrobiales bacterium]|nr:GNAT family N-acetyltransferase [Verrucomicrobiales bacterium]
MTIREVTEVDSERIAALMGQLGYPQSAAESVLQIKTYMDSSTSFAIVAEEAGIIVGFASFHATPLFHQAGSLGRITAMCVDANSRRAGAGRALLSELERRAGCLGCARIEVSSGDHRESEAHVFYDSNGYKTDCRRFLKVLPKSEE